jgi:hypothetical protein
MISIAVWRTGTLIVWKMDNVDCRVGDFYDGDFDQREPIGLGHKYAAFSLAWWREMVRLRNGIFKRQIDVDLMLPWYDPRTRKLVIQTQSGGGGIRARYLVGMRGATVAFKPRTNQRHRNPCSEIGLDPRKILAASLHLYIPLPQLTRWYVWLRRAGSS